MSVKLLVENRENTSNNKLRKNGIIPAVYYHKGEESVSLQLLKKDLSKVMQAHERIVELSNGKMAIIKEVQKDPVSNKILHVSFEGVVKGEKFTAEVPLEVVFEGKPSWQQDGYVLRQLVNSIEVETTPSNLPEKLTMDVSDYSKEDTLTLKDLKLPKGVEVTVEELDLVTFSPEKVQEEVEEETVEESTETASESEEVTNTESEDSEE